MIIVRPITASTANKLAESGAKTLPASATKKQATVATIKVHPGSATSKTQTNTFSIKISQDEKKSVQGSAKGTSKSQTGGKTPANSKKQQAQSSSKAQPVVVSKKSAKVASSDKAPSKAHGKSSGKRVNVHIHIIRANKGNRW